MKLKDFTAQYNIEYFKMKSASEYSYCKVRENDLWGIFKVNEDAAVRISESIYSSILHLEVFAENINFSGFIVSKNQKQGFIDTNGNEIIPIIYNQIELMDDCPCLCATIEESSYEYKNGIFKLDGSIVIPVKYKFIHILWNNEKNDYYFKISTSLKCGIYNSKGKEIIPVEFDFINYIKSYNCFLVEKNYKNGVLNNKGEQIIPIEYDDIEYDNIDFPYVFITQKNDKWGIYEKNKEIIPTTYDHIDLIHYKNKPIYKVTSNKLYNIVNSEGKKIFNKEYIDIKLYDNGNSLYDNSCSCRSITTNFVITTQNIDGTFSLFDEKGDLLIEIIDYLGYECNNSDYRIFSQKGKIGVFCLSKKQIIFPAIYDDITSISNPGNRGKLIVSYNQKKGIYDYEGNEILPTIYDSIVRLNSGYFCNDDSQIYYKVISEGRQGVITENNETIISIEYDKIDFYDLYNFHIAYAMISNNHKLGIFYGREILIPAKYDEIKLIYINGIDMFRVKEDNKYGIINLKGQTLVVCKYDSIEYEHSLFFARTNNIISIISLDGEIIFKEIKDIKPFTTSIYKLKKTNNKYILCNHIYQTISPEADEFELFTNNIPNTLYYLIKDTSYWGVCRVLEKGYKYILPCSYVRIEHHLINNSIIFIIQTKDNKYGVYNNYSKEVLPTIYDKIELHTISNTYYYKVYQKEHIGICSYDGEIIIPVSYHQVDELIENNTVIYFKVTKDNLIGFYTHEGKIIIHPYIEDLEEIRTQKLIAFKIKLGNFYGLLYNNKIVIDIMYENITLLHHYSDCLLIEVTRNNKVGLFNINGEQLIPTFYDKIISENGNCLIKLHNLWGIYTIKNNNLILPQYEEYKTYSDFLFVKKENLWGIYYDNNEIYPPLFENIEIWRDEDGDNYPAYYEIKYFYVLIKSKKGYGIINEWGTTILPDKYDKIEIIKKERLIEESDDNYYSGNYTYDITFKVKLKELWGFYNEKGTEIYPPIFNNINNIDTEGDGIIKVGELWGYMNNFELVLPTIFNFIEHKASTLILKINQLTDIYDMSTNSYPLLHKLDEKIICLREIYLYTEKEHQWRILNSIGKEVCPPFPLNANIVFTIHGVILLEIDNKIGVYSNNGLELVPPIYKSFIGKKEIELTTYFIMQDFNNKYGCTTNSFQKKEIKIPFIYDYILKGSGKIHFYAKKDNKILGLNENGEILSEKDLKIYNLSLGYEEGILEGDINKSIIINPTNKT